MNDLMKGLSVARVGARLWLMAKTLGIMAVVSGVVASAAVGGKALSHAYDVAYNGAGSVAQPSEAPVLAMPPRTMPGAVTAQPSGVPVTDNGYAAERASLRERRIGDAVEQWRRARSYERMNVYGVRGGDSERVERAARALEDATW